MGQILASLNLRGNSDIVPEIGFDIESKLQFLDIFDRKFISLIFDINRRYTIQ